RNFTTIAIWLCLGLLWFRLIDHLRIEWTVNPQYAYGWAVPGLCLWLVWRRRTKIEDGSWQLDSKQPGQLPSPISYLLAPLPFAAASLAYAIPRLIAEANPDWRLVSWSLALEVITVTLLLFSGSRGPVVRGPVVRSPVVPLSFFLVSIP